MRIALSGFAGVGKSTLIDYTAKKYPNVFISPESAREVAETQDYFQMTDEEGSVFQKSVMDNELTKINLLLINNIKHALMDRSVIDNLAFAILFFGKDRVNYNKVSDHLNQLCEKYSINHIYDETILIRISTNKDFINEHVLCDPLRRKTITDDAENFIHRGIAWEESFLEIHHKLPMVSKDVRIIEHFTSNSKFMEDFDLHAKKVWL